MLEQPVKENNIFQNDYLVPLVKESLFLDPRDKTDMSENLYHWTDTNLEGHTRSPSAYLPHFAQGTAKILRAKHLLSFPKINKIDKFTHSWRFINLKGLLPYIYSPFFLYLSMHFKIEIYFTLRNSPPKDSKLITIPL